MLDIQNSQLMRFLWVICFLIFVALLRLFFVQVIHHEYYEEKTLKQRKTSKDLLLRREYLILPEDTLFNIEVNLALIMDKNKKITFCESMKNLANLLGKDSMAVYEKCIEKQNVVKRIINRKVEKEYLATKGNRDEILKEYEDKEFNKPYPLFMNKSKALIMELEARKYLWRKKNETILERYDAFRGFSVRAQTSISK